MNAINNRFGEILRERFVPIELKDTNGFVDRDFKEVLMGFGFAYNINPPYLNSEIVDLFEDSLFIRSFLYGYVFIPQHDGTYLHSRRLKHNEELFSETPRFVNSVVAYDLGVPTPRPLALLIGKTSGYFVSVYIGCDNLANGLGYSGEKKDLQKEFAARNMALVKLEERLTNEYESRAPFGLSGLLPIPFLEQVTSLGEMERNLECILTFMEFSERLYERFCIPELRWFSELAYYAKHEENDTPYRNALRKKIRTELRKYVRQYNKVHELEKKIREPIKRKPAEIELIAKNFGISLRKSSDVGCFLYDIEPRDVVVDPDLRVFFVDMEGVEYKGRPLDFGERKRQIKLIKTKYPKVFVERANDIYFGN